MSDRVQAWKCGQCFDIGFTYETVDGRERVTPCHCRVPIQPNSPEQRVQATRIPPLYLGRTLGNFEPRTHALLAAYEQTLSYCTQFPHVGQHAGLGLLFWGAKGSGKTHLAAAALAELVSNKRVSGLMWNYRELYREICRSYDKSTFLSDLAPFQKALEVDILLLDDLGSRTMPDWAHNTLFEIVDARYRGCKTTFVTTSLLDGDPGTAFAADPLQRREYLVERISRPVWSRLKEMCLFLPTETPEERRAKAPPRRPTTLSGMRRLQNNDGNN